MNFMVTDFELMLTNFYFTCTSLAQFINLNEVRVGGDLFISDYQTFINFLVLQGTSTFQNFNYVHV